jgi:outer membrane protein assembly factor BamB
VFVAGSEDEEGKRRSLYCFDRKDGKQLWVKTIEFGKAVRTHATNTHSPSTPASDGKSVVVWHGSAGLHCYDFEGKELWKRDLGEFDHMWGEGTSPVIHDGCVYLNSGPDKKKVFVAAFKLATGETVWEKEEPFKGNGDNNEDGKPMGSWATPVIAKVDGKDQLLCAMPTRVVAYAPEDGKLLWSCDGLRFKKGDLAYSSPVIVGDTLVTIGGYNGPNLGVKLGGSGDVTATNRLWLIQNNPQSIGSGVAIDGYVYMPFAGANTIECIDPKTGKSLWKEKQKSPFWGSIVVAGGKAYVTDQKGVTVVFKPNHEKFEPIAANELGEESNSTPAISNGEIFIRTFKALYCIAE